MVADILLLGAYQVLLLERVPDSAAVNEAVEQCKAYGNRRAAGLVNGFFGGGGGMVLVPLLAGKCGLERRSAFASSVAIILPLCALSAVIYFARGQLELLTALPYLLGGLLGGLVGGKLFPKVPVVWLRRAFALVIFYGAWKALTA